ncbi:MAG: hypothetical protein FWD42_01635 [Solirubrobacterales bacterium]|nr:hypothetical protein [Solirubrobacterales bacterium]
MGEEQREESPGQRERAAQEAVLGLLLYEHRRGAWSRAEIHRAIGGPAVEVVDALATLHHAGLVHLDGEMVHLSLAAEHMHQLDL